MEIAEYDADRKLPEGRAFCEGIIRFAGEVEFASGQWFGVELMKPWGKNGGQVGLVGDLAMAFMAFVCFRVFRLDLLGDSMRQLAFGSSR